MKNFTPYKDEKIGNKYVLKEFLGDGSYGYVWKAIKLKDEQEVALKIPKNQESGDKVLKEGSLLKDYTHPNIIDIKWMGRVNGIFVIEMEYFESHTLAEEIKEKGHIKPRLFSNLYDLFFQILEAIDFMHSLNLCHGDIKPDNILLGNKVKITDFGTSKLIEDLFVETIGVGTCGFIAPEVVNSHKRYLRSDIYSLGALLYFLLTGQRVYDSLSQVINNEPYKKPREINSNIPRSVEKVILKALARDPEDRYETVEKFKSDLEEAIISRDKEVSVESYEIESSKKGWLEKLSKLYKNKDWVKAEKFLEQHRTTEDVPDLNFHCAYVHFKLENYYRSLNYLDDINFSKIEDIRRNNFSEEVYFLKAKVYTKLKRYEQALDLYKELYNNSENNLKYKYRLAIVNGLCDNLDQAIQLLEEINQEEPGRLEVLKKLAYAYDQMKEFEKARGYFKYVEKLAPNDEKVKERLELYDSLL